jgi:hypothetical protein
VLRALVVLPWSVLVSLEEACAAQRRDIAGRAWQVKAVAFYLSQHTTFVEIIVWTIQIANVGSR